MLSHETLEILREQIAYLEGINIAFDPVASELDTLEKSFGSIGSTFLIALLRDKLTQVTGTLQKIVDNDLASKVPLGGLPS